MIEKMLNTDLAAYYAERAAEYEEIYLKPERQNDLSIIKSFLREKFRNKNVMEVACGTGYWTQVIAETAHCVLATDYNSEVLAVAGSKSYRCPNVQFQIAEAYSLDSLKGEFNAGLSAFWWSHIPNTQINHFLKSFHSALQDNASIVIVDNRFVEGSSTPIHRTDESGNTYQLRGLKNGSVHEIVKNFPSHDELMVHFSSVAQNIQQTDLEYFWMVEYSITK
jgi:ubiquinone/menaquinone biosynthesis C-methylase UbiE